MHRIIADRLNETISRSISAALLVLVTVRSTSMILRMSLNSNDDRPVNAIVLESLRERVGTNRELIIMTMKQDTTFTMPTILQTVAFMGTSFWCL
jgi:hypothetical protein